MMFHLRKRAALFVALVMTMAALSVDGRAAPERAAAGTDVKIAQNKDTSRVEFVGPASGRITLKRSGQTLVIRVPGTVSPNLTRLRLSPPQFIKSADATTGPGFTEVTIVLADGADASSGSADGGFFINTYKRGMFDPKPDAKAPAKPSAQPDAVAGPAPPVKLDPRPINGIVPVTHSAGQGETTLQFTWRAPVPAAVFRRADGVWVVFDAQAQLDMAKWPKALIDRLQPRPVYGQGFSAVRLRLSPDQLVTVGANGGVWSVTLGANQPVPSANIAIAGDENSNKFSLTAEVLGASRAIWLTDPVVGDKLVAIPAMAPVSGLPFRREFVDVALLRSYQGLGLEPIADNLDVSVAVNQVRIGRPQGLALSADNRSTGDDGGGGAPQAASMPGMVDFIVWPKTGTGGFNGRYNALFAAAAAEAGEGANARTEARMALARFLIASDMAYEGIGVLNALARANRASLDDPEFRGLRGAAKAMVGRNAEALTDLAVAELAADPASALWRGYAADKLGQWEVARDAFAAGMPALGAFPAVWRVRFARANTQALTALKDFPKANQAIAQALKPSVNTLDWLQTLMVQADLFDKMGDTPRALAMYEAMSKAGSDQIRLPALLRATQIKQALGKIPPVAALDAYDRVRIGWRGGATEVKAIGSQAQLYVDLGRYREALTVLGSMGKRLPDTPEARLLGDDSSAVFRSLYLDGLADSLQPIQALALFYDFKYLTPIGADGDLIVRRLARRLVDVDLLDQAADLLKYQVDNRLEGLPRSLVATDLAMVQLMNRKPEKALQAINDSRSTLLPAALGAERRLIEARAWNELGKPDNALEILATDRSADATDIRNDIAWRKKVWTDAGPAFERKLGDRWKSTDNALSEDEENSLLRSAVSYSLANDSRSLARLKQRYAPLVDKARQADALRLALDGVDSDAGVNPTQVLSTLSQNDQFSGWAAKAKQKFKAAVLSPATSQAKPGAKAAAATKAQAPTRRQG